MLLSLVAAIRNLLASEGFAAIAVNVLRIRRSVVASTPGIKAEGEWHARKHVGAKRRVWRKIHLRIDDLTLEIGADEITEDHIGDAPVLPDLRSQIIPDQEIRSVTVIRR